MSVQPGLLWAGADYRPVAPELGVPRPGAVLEPGAVLRLGTVPRPGGVVILGGGPRPGP